MNKFKFLLSLTTALFVFLTLPSQILAATSQNVICTTNGKQGVNTALGCVPINDQNALVGWILRWSIGVGGGIAFLLILYAGFQIMTSQGDPKKLQGGQELLTSAIGGLILLLFSLFILRFIGLDILGIPGLEA